MDWAFFFPKLWLGGNKPRSFRDYKSPVILITGLLVVFGNIALKIIIKTNKAEY